MSGRLPGAVARPGAQNVPHGLHRGTKCQMSTKNRAVAVPLSQNADCRTDRSPKKGRRVLLNAWANMYPLSMLLAEPSPIRGIFLALEYLEGLLKGDWLLAMDLGGPNSATKNGEVMEGTFIST
ncbi:hypothetical protein NDU88_010500 [Pleurodeles waltl]|uniref:Uncharacterized protein n=1 Tax=Pleurodeles waltl TaxID=8319 RepID=A0AAV7R0E1_PLEWA|nr:hypothetical protein NDU88_010500 [Pleurodeles waltl]